MTSNTPIHVGTSGWHYDHWSGPFYPEDLAKDEFLAYYAEHFQTVEVNNTFYQLPEEETLVAWRETVPADFVFSVKASRYITHMKKLTDPQEPVSNFLERVAVLGDRLGPILFQLPPHWHFNPDRLEAFLDVLPARYRYTFEFRDPSWFDSRAYEALSAHGAAFCIYELAGDLSPKEVTADFVYVRLHGPDGAYQGRYGTDGLTGWAGAFSTWARQGKEIFCYFDNDPHGYAVQDARILKDMLGV